MSELGFFEHFYVNFIFISRKIASTLQTEPN